MSLADKLGGKGTDMALKEFKNNFKDEMNIKFSFPYSNNSAVLIMALHDLAERLKENGWRCEYGASRIEGELWSGYVCVEKEGKEYGLAGYIRTGDGKVSVEGELFANENPEEVYMDLLRYVKDNLKVDVSRLKPEQ